MLRNKEDCYRVSFSVWHYEGGCLPLKEKIMNNFALKLLAAIMAFSVWFIINNIDDPVNSKVFRNIQVEIQNEETLASLDKVYEVLSGGTVNVTASAKESVLRKLTATDIVAVADLSNLSLTNAVSIKLTCPKYENVTLRSDVDMLRITLEDEATEQFKVDVNTIGMLPEGYALGEVKVRPNLIKVSGAQSQIERISEVRVEVDVSNVTEDFTKRVQPMAYDANGKLMDSTRMTFSSEDVRVSVYVNETKKVPVQLTTKGKPADGYHLLSAEYEPKEILVTGTKEALDNFTMLPISVDIDGLSMDQETEVLLADYLPRGISVVGDVTTVNIKLTISKQKLQKLTFDFSEIEVRNLKEDLQLEYLGKQNVIEVYVAPVSRESYHTIVKSDVQAYIDCVDLKEGNHTLEVKFVENENMIIVSDATVKISLKEKKTTDKVEKSKEPENTPLNTITPEETANIEQENNTDKDEKDEEEEE